MLACHHSRMGIGNVVHAQLRTSRGPKKAKGVGETHRGDKDIHKRVNTRRRWVRGAAEQGDQEVKEEVGEGESGWGNHVRITSGNQKARTP